MQEVQPNERSYSKLFSLYDVVETSYHFISNQIVLHLCDDPGCMYHKLLKILSLHLSFSWQIKSSSSKRRWSVADQREEVPDRLLPIPFSKR